jgi:small ligand-binding sensory domain FIST
MTAKSGDATMAFRVGHVGNANWRAAVDEVLREVQPLPAGANLGFLYISDRLVHATDAVLDSLKQGTGIRDWVGSVGIGVLATGVEYFDEPALVVMIAALPEGEFKVFSGRSPAPPLSARTGSGAVAAHFAVIHGDPHTSELPQLIEDMSAKLQSGYLVGGISSSRGTVCQIANEVLVGGLSGVVLSSRIGVSTRHTQGCVPLHHEPGRAAIQHIVTEVDRNIIATLDGRPALDVLCGEIGEPLARDIERAANYVHVGLPITGSDTGDYLVRNLIGYDPDGKRVAIGDYVEPGMPIFFCWRDGNAARDDLLRMLDDIGGGLAEPPRGGLYFSCLGRGENMFGARSAELSLIRDKLGDVPLAGFFCNGEIAHDKLYGYTGVLTLFH